MHANSTDLHLKQYQHTQILDKYSLICLSRNEYYNSKDGRIHDAEAADAATQGGTVRG